MAPVPRSPAESGSDQPTAVDWVGVIILVCQSVMLFIMSITLRRERKKNTELTDKNNDMKKQVRVLEDRNADLEYRLKRLTKAGENHCDELEINCNRAL